MSGISFVGGDIAKVFNGPNEIARITYQNVDLWTNKADYTDPITYNSSYGIALDNYPNWKTVGTDPMVAVDPSGFAYATTPSSTGTFSAFALWELPVNTDYNMVTMTALEAARGYVTGLILASDINLNNFAYAQVSNSSGSRVIGSYLNGVGTNRVSMSTNVTAGQTISFQQVPEGSAYRYTFQAGSNQWSWLDSGNAVATGPGHRYGGFFVTGNKSSFSSARSIAVDNFHYFDQ
jgi:hypothetical protein